MGLKTLARRYPLGTYFIMTFSLSWAGAFAVVANKLFNREPIPPLDGILMFPVMLLGPSVTGILLTYLREGKSGLHSLWLRMRKSKISLRWYALTLLLPPVLILLVLLVLEESLSPVYTPNFFLIGILFGIPAGFLEEIGWSGFAIPSLLSRFSIFKSGLILGLLWGLWHLPVVDFLGAASPHGNYFWAFFGAFAGILSAMRVLMVWIYSRTGSIWIIQLLHIISTGCLVVLGPFKTSPGQESLWYALYAAVLWIVVSILIKMGGGPDRVHKDSQPIQV